MPAFLQPQGNEHLRARRCSFWLWKSEPSAAAVRFRLCIGFALITPGLCRASCAGLYIHVSSDFLRTPVPATFFECNHPPPPSEKTREPSALPNHFFWERAASLDDHSASTPPPIHNDRSNLSLSAAATAAVFASIRPRAVCLKPSVFSGICLSHCTEREKRASVRSTQY